MHLLNPLSVARGQALFPERELSANCLAGDAVGKCAYVTGPMIADRYQVTTCLPTDSDKIPAVGVIVEKTSPTECQVQVFGVTDSVSGLTPGRAYFVGLNGSLVLLPPTPAPSSFAYIQPMGVALSTDRFLVSPSLSITKRIG